MGCDVARLALPAQSPSLTVTSTVTVVCRVPCGLADDTYGQTTLAFRQNKAADRLRPGGCAQRVT
jgi:hypothetical protein